MQDRQAGRSWLAWILGALVIGGAAVWLFRPVSTPPSGAEAPKPPPPVLANLPEAAAPAAAGGIAHPIAPDAADAAIPPLADSDEAAWSALAALVGDDGVLSILLRDHLVERLVVMVDNLTQPSVGTRVLPYRPLAPALATSTDASGALTLDAAANARRYAPFVRVFVQLDPQALAASYRRFYPLFQQAYVDLGYPQGYFNDRLVAVIDHLLQAPVPAQPIAVAPAASGKLRFADPGLESLSIGQKALLRLAPEQAEAVKRQLRAIRAAITGR